MAIQAEFGIIGEIGAELQKERAEIPIHTVHVKMVDHGGGPHQPGISGARLFVPSPLGAEHRRFLLRLAYEQYPFHLVELAEILCRDIIFALSLAEMHNRNALPLDKSIHGGEERLAHRIHQSARDELVAPVIPEKTRYPHLA